MEERQHEVEIQTILGPPSELLHSIGDGLKYAPGLFTTTNLGGRFVHLLQREAVRETERTCTVIKVGEDVDVLCDKRALERRLVDTVERAGCQIALLFLLEDGLREETALWRGWLRGTGHVDLDNLAGSKFDLDLADHAGDDARVDDWLLSPGSANFGLFGRGDELVDRFAGFHETIPEMRVLVKVEVTPTERELVFVVAGSKTRGHPVANRGEGGFEHDLGRATAKVEDGSGRIVLDRTNFAEEVVGGDPGIDT